MKPHIPVVFAIVFSSLLALAQAPASQEPAVMVVSVAHDSSAGTGGIGTALPLGLGVANVQPIAWVTPAGEWIKIRCTVIRPDDCKDFDSNYLSKPHQYEVISADGVGAAVEVPKMSLDDECFGYGGEGGFAGKRIRFAAVAAENSSIFTSGQPARRVAEADAQIIRQALANALGSKLDSQRELRVYAMNLEGHSMVVVQRAFEDYADKPDYQGSNAVQLHLIFAIGSMRDGRFHLLHWKENLEDEDEQILGLIHLKSGHDFLVTAISEPESNYYRIYGIRDGKLAMVFQGGGGTC
ncbi:MAG TPA: hypothetical protein VIY53_12760 [Acidobacteriaceae bacterium]